MIRKLLARRARRRGRRDVAPRPRRPASRARPRTTASTSSRCSPATARSTRRPTGSLHTDTALAPLPGGSTNVYARTLGYPARRRSTPTNVLLASLAPARRPTRVGRRPSPTAGRSCSTPGIGFDAAVIRRVERHGELKRYVVAPAARRGRVRDVVPRRRPQHAALRRRARRPARRSTACASRSSRRRSRTPTSGRRPLDVAPDAGLDTAARRSPRSGRFDVVDARRRRGVGDADRAGSSRTAPGIVPPRRPPRARTSQRTRPFPYQVDGDDVGDTEQPRHRLRARRADGRPALTRHAERGQRDVGDVRDDRVDAGRGERARSRPGRRRSRRRPASPRSCAAAMPRRGRASVDATIGIQPRVTVRGRDRRAATRRSWPCVSHAGRELGRERAHRVDRAEVERRDDRRRRVARPRRASTTAAHDDVRRGRRRAPTAGT